MEQTTEAMLKEPDEIVGSLVLAYIFGVIGWLATVLLWVFYFRGYA
jgi:hypothetical protein